MYVKIGVTRISSLARYCYREEIVPAFGKLARSKPAVAERKGGEKENG
jgi:hypothetical protein